MKTALSLRLALTSNAIFSFSSALLMIFIPTQVGHWLGIQAPLIFQMLGIGLALFAVELIYQATRQRMTTWRALIASIADFSWVIGSILLLMVFPQLFSSLGNILIMGIAGVVFCFGTWQLWAIGKAHQTGQNGNYRHCIIVETNAPADKMWQVVSNIGDIKHYMPSLKRSFVLDGKTPSVGAIRVCEDISGKQWSEECIDFKTKHSFTVRFLSEAPNFPFPAKTMLGGWEVTPTNEGSQIMVWWELEPKTKLLAPVILPLLAFQADRDFPKIVQRMANATLEKNSKIPSNMGIFSRLLPRFC